MTRAREGNEHWTKMIRQHMECPAWRALSLPAQAIYPRLKLEWKAERLMNDVGLAAVNESRAERATEKSH